MPEVQGYWPVEQTIEVENTGDEDAPFLVELNDLDVSLEYVVTWDRDLKGFDFSGQTFAINFQVMYGIGHDLTLQSAWNENSVNVEDLVLSVDPFHMSFPPGKWKLQFWLQTSTNLVNTGYKVSIENDYTAIVASDCSGCTDTPIKDKIRTALAGNDMPIEFSPTLSTLGGTGTFRHLNSHTTITYYSGLFYIVAPIGEAETTTEKTSGQAASTEQPPGSLILETPMSAIAESTPNLQADDAKYLRRAW